LKVRTGNAPRAMVGLRNLASASCDGTATATSLLRCAATPATPPGVLPCWASQARETDKPALAETLAGTPDSHGLLVAGWDR